MLAWNQDHEHIRHCPVMLLGSSPGPTKAAPALLPGGHDSSRGSAKRMRVGKSSVPPVSGERHQPPATVQPCSSWAGVPRCWQDQRHLWGLSWVSVGVKHPGGFIIFLHHVKK